MNMEFILQKFLISMFTHTLTKTCTFTCMLAYAHMHVIHEKLMKPKQLQMEKLKTDMR